MKIFKFISLLFVLLSTWQIASAQNLSDRQDVVKKLNELKPAETKEYKFKVIVPEKIEKLPENLRLDLSYKIGHYEFAYVALRFEREISSSDVIVTKFAYGSALAFWKEYAKEPTSFVAEQGKISKENFDKLLNLANLYYRSDIEKIYKTSGIGGGSSTHSSGDGRILINLIDSQNALKSIINESGTLISGKLKERSSDGFDSLRVHLFWQVFYDYLEKTDIFGDLEKSKAEEIALSRLEEPLNAENYTEYYRLAAYVAVLGEIGTSKSIPVLEKIFQSNKLAKDWDTYLSEHANQAIKKIKSRSK